MRDTSLAFREVTPAYGRDYKNAAQARDAWSSGADFRDAETGRYCSIRDFPRGTHNVLIRYARLTKVTNA